MAFSVEKADGHWVIRVPISEPVPSASGKTLTVGSTHGNKTVMVDGEAISIGANVYKENPNSARDIAAAAALAAAKSRNAGGLTPEAAKAIQRESALPSDQRTQPKNGASA